MRKKLTLKGTDTKSTVREGGGGCEFNVGTVPMVAQLGFVGKRLKTAV